VAVKPDPRPSELGRNLKKRKLLIAEEVHVQLPDGFSYDMISYIQVHLYNLYIYIDLIYPSKVWIFFFFPIEQVDIPVDVVII
jgi:hypothetical protein